MNPNTYRQSYLKGSRPDSGTLDVEVGRVFKLDETTGELTKEADGGSLAAPVYAACSISGYVKEVLYRVFYAEREGNYVIKRIVADFIIVSSSFSFGTVPCEGKESLIT